MRGRPPTVKVGVRPPVATQVVVAARYAEQIHFMGIMGLLPLTRSQLVRTVNQPGVMEI